MLYLSPPRFIGASRIRKRMLASLTANGRIDRLAIGLSGLCLVHCIGTAVLVMMLASAGGLLVDPRIHEIGLVLPVAIGSLGLGTMAGSLTFPHGPEEIVISVLGVLILALGHDLNRRAVI